MAYDKSAQVIVGNTLVRTGKGWIGSGDVIDTFEQEIPLAVINEKLLNWEPIEVPSGNLIPCDIEEASTIMPDGRPGKWLITPGAKGIVRSDNFRELGRHSETFKMHIYRQLMGWLSNVLQDRLRVDHIATLRGGAQLALTVSLDESLHDGSTGVDFMPYMFVRTSLDGSLATTISAGNRVIICDNMYQGIERAAKNAGRQMKIRHTRNSMNPAQIQQAQDVMLILQRSAQDMTDFMASLAQVEVSRDQFFKVLDELVPASVEGDTKAKVTKTANKRDALTAVYTNDPMAAPWAGTAWGVVQAMNTYQHHYQAVRGASRSERVLDRAMRGDLGASDALVIEALEKVLQRDLALV